MNKALFWDFDGTLVYSESLWTGSVYKALKNNLSDTDIKREDIKPKMRQGFTWHTYDDDHTPFIGQAWWDRMAKRFSCIYQELGVEKNKADYISKSVREIILDVDKYKLFDDAILTLTAAKEAGYKNYIISNNYPELDEIIVKLNIAPYFEEYIISGKIGYDKPRKEIYNYALKVAGNPDVCFMIGDNPIADVWGAKNMGIPAILVHKEVQCDADYSFSCLKDIIELL